MDVERSPSRDCIFRKYCMRVRAPASVHAHVHVCGSRAVAERTEQQCRVTSARHVRSKYACTAMHSKYTTLHTSRHAARFAQNPVPVPVAVGVFLSSSDI